MLSIASRWRHFLLGSTIALIVVALLSGQTNVLAGDSGDDLTRRQIEAGEFAPAFDRVQRLEGGEDRDAQLARIAGAQASVGARDAALNTLAQIDDDRVLDGAVGEMARPGAAGGGAQPDFDALIELITTTVQPDTWDEAGGAGAINEFAGGVFVDAGGVLQRILRTADSPDLAALRKSARAARRSADVRRSSPLRKVSLTRLEREVQLALAAGKPLSEEMMTLGGLQRITHVFVYPDSGDLVVAGPAGDWKIDAEGRPVDVDHGRPVLRLDDLVAVLRQSWNQDGVAFGCSIDPTQAGLAAAQKYASDTAEKSHNAAWMKGFRDAMGQQTVRVFGVDGQSHLAQLLVEADYAMKRIVIGLDKGAAEVPSVLDLVRIPAGGQAPPLDVLRFWFALNYRSLSASPDRLAYALTGSGVKLLAENEMLTERGERIRAGKADPLSQEFAGNFTQHFDILAARTPIFAELQNVFDMAVVAALLRHESLADRANWRMTCFGDENEFPLPKQPAPAAVDSLVNQRRITQGKTVHVLTAVSGGVRIDTASALNSRTYQVDETGQLGSRKDASSAPAAAPRRAWWWD